MRHYILAIVLACACLAHAKVEARSLYCDKASTVIERAICENEDVVDLDIELAGDLEKAIAEAPYLRDGLLTAQRHWLVPGGGCASRGVAIVRSLWIASLRHHSCQFGYIPFRSNVRAH
jgi:uncharacterized protein